MTEYSYKVLNIKNSEDVDELADAFNELGKSGWRLVSSIRERGAEKTVFIFIKAYTILEPVNE